MRGAELAAGSQNLVPMLGVLFLATCLQGAQTESMNDWWRCQFFFYVCTYALLVKALSCLPIIFWGNFDRDQPATLPEYMHALLKGLAELVVYVGMGAIALWMYSKSQDATSSPLFKVLLVLSMLFFATSLFLHVSQTSDDLGSRRGPNELLRDTGAVPLLKAAVETAMFCPMLCVLVCSAHLRALELSQYQGHPPLWVQSSMYLCMCACVMQLSMVIVTGIVAGEPAEAMPKSLYSTFTAAQQSLTTSTGWTTVAILGQYTSMACIFASTAAMICGIFFATPANTS